MPYTNFGGAGVRHTGRSRTGDAGLVTDDGGNDILACVLGERESNSVVSTETYGGEVRRFHGVAHPQ